MKLKNIFLGFSVIILIFAPIILTIACGVSYGEGYSYYGDYQVITDDGAVNDKSFNQSSFDATKDFVRSQNKLYGTQKTFGFIQPTSTTRSLLQKAYLSSLKKGASVFILPGFTHTDSGDIQGWVMKHIKPGNINGIPLKNTPRFIVPDGFISDNPYGIRTINPKDIDGFVDGSGITEASRRGVYTLAYASAESGFLAAVYTGLFFNEHKKIIIGSKIKVSTFGGVSIPFGVTSYMDGFLQGIEYFNENKKKTMLPEELILQNARPSVHDFTGSFEPGAATPNVQNLINKGVQVILPVAGPQTGDVTGLIEKNNLSGTVFAIGVDVNQAPIYGSDKIIGSAIKGIYASTIISLNAIKNNSNRDLNDLSNTLAGPFGPGLNFNKKTEKIVNSDLKSIFGDWDSQNYPKGTVGYNWLQEFKISMTNDEALKATTHKINIYRQFTGFVPSKNYEEAKILASLIYKDALNFASSGSVKGMLASPSGKQSDVNGKYKTPHSIAERTYNNLGSFNKDGHGGLF